jgi:cation transport ATPase
MLRVHPGRMFQSPSVLALDPAVLGRSEVVVQLRGVVCGVCAARSESAFRRIDGVEDASVDLATQRATLRLSPASRVAATTIQDALQAGLDRAVIGVSARRWIGRAAVRLGQFRRGIRREAS